MKHIRTGQEYTIHQICNDWITVEERPQPISPLHVQLTPDEVTMVRQLETEGQVGHLFGLFDLSDEGRFTRRRD